MRKIKLCIEAIIHINRYLCRILPIMKNGQSKNFEIMQLAHRLEKGLINRNPKPMWGWEKAERLALLLSQNHSAFSYQTGLAVLQSYIGNKKQEKAETQLAFDLENKYHFDTAQVNGGLLQVDKPSFNNSDVELIEKFVNSRHSTRNFDSKELDYEKVKKAVELALHCPSACNRQPFKVYLVPDDIRCSKIGVKCDSAASLYITGAIDAYNFTEMMDWIVSPSIFAGYLTLALHCYGIGSCIYKKELVRTDDYNNRVAKVCGIPSNEQLILEIRIGMYPETIAAAVSNRLPIENIYNIIKE